MVHCNRTYIAEADAISEAGEEKVEFARPCFPLFLLTAHLFFRLRFALFPQQSTGAHNPNITVLIIAFTRNQCTSLNTVVALLCLASGEIMK